MQNREISVAARESRLSLVQFQEVLSELNQYHPDIQFQLTKIKTLGDIDQKSSLRNMDKTDFFTRELDFMLLEGKCRITIHSAKDLPEPLRQGICIAAITEGIDSSDSLVLKEGETLDSLPKGAFIATSSKRREEIVKALRDDLTFVDIRGTIEQRLEKMTHGVVIAEAALIRLNLTHLNRIKLPGETAPLQGKLAVLAREDDKEILELFSCIDSRCVLST